MRKILLVAPLVAAFMLSGCATTGGTSNTDIIKQIREAAVAACGFLPTINTVAQILASGNPIVATASGVAGAICAAVANLPPAAARRGAAPPTVAGVVIHGRFVR